MNEDSIFHPSNWDDVWSDLARFMQELEQEAEQEKQVTILEPGE